MSKKLEELVIDRLKWHRGKDAYGSALLVKDTHNMCCLGFKALQDGAKKCDISGVNTPVDLESKITTPLQQKRYNKLLKTSFSKLVNNGGNSEICNQLMRTNDDIDIFDKEREAQLKKLFRKIGIKVKFIN